MSSSPQTFLKGIKNIGGINLGAALERSFIEYLNWGLLGAGGFFNVEPSQSSAWGGDQSRLRLSGDERYNGTVYEGFRANWVWESGVNLQTGGSQPIQASGVIVNGEFISVDTPASGLYSHTIDYPNGRVIFNSPLTNGETVQCAFSHRWVQVETTEHPGFEQLFYRSYRVDDPTFLQTSGNWGVLPEERVQLPAIFVEQLGSEESQGLQLGGGLIIRRACLSWVFAENKFDRDNLVDLINYQNRLNVGVLDYNLMAQNGYSPLTAIGGINEGALTYPQLVQDVANSGYLYLNAFIIDSKIMPQEEKTNYAFVGKVRTIFEIYSPWL